MKLWILALAGLAVSELANAQEAPAPTTSAPLEEIVVTGSRIARKDYTSDTPVFSVTGATLQNQSEPTIDDALNRLPQFAGGASPTGEKNSNTGADNAGAATLNLRNLGDNRNLVLLDGQRLQPVTDSFAVDINALPAAIIDGVEVITGGASAVYGSDALSGVVNFKLKHDFQGLEVDVRGGKSELGDYGNVDVSLLAGARLSDGKGSVMFAADYTDRGATLQRDRPFFQRAFGTGTGTWEFQFLGTGYWEPVFGGLTNLPNPAVLGAAVGAPGPISPVSEIGFNTNHTSLYTVDTPVYGYSSGVYPQNPLYTIGPQGVVTTGNYSNYATIPLTRFSSFGRFEYNLTDDITGYAQGLFTHYDVETRTFAPAASLFWGAFVPVDAGHPVPASFADVLGSRPTPAAPWFLERELNFMGIQEQEGTTQIFQLNTGMNGKLWSDWTWGVSGSHGESNIVLDSLQGQASIANYQQLMALPDYGAGFSNGVGGGCTSGISPFISNVSQDCVNYLTVHPQNTVRQKQDVFEANMQGGVLTLPAGDLKDAFGADYRNNSYSAVVDNLLLPNPADGSLGPCAVCSSVIQGFNQVSNAGAIHVWEIYDEVLVPILKDLPAVKSLDLDVAYRRSKYSLAGGVNTYKADGNWRVNNAVMFRGGFEHAVRAPNPIELFSATASTITLGGLDPCVNIGANVASYGNSPSNPNAAKVQALCAALTPGATAANFAAPFIGSGTAVLSGTSEGNSSLAPETANTVTGGVVFSPRGELPWGGHLSTSLDYYSIDLKGAVGLLDNAQTYELCFNSNGVSNPTYDPANPYCRLIIRAPMAGGGTPLSVSNVYENEGGIRTQGIDFQADTGLPVGPGNFDINMAINYLLTFDQSIVSGAPFVNYDDTINASGAAYYRWRSLVTPTYTLGDLQAGLRWKFLPRSNDVTCVTSACAAPTASYQLFDLFVGYNFGKVLRFTVGIDNLMNREPPVVGGIPGNTNVGEYDLIGRRFWAGMQAKF